MQVYSLDKPIEGSDGSEISVEVKSQTLDPEEWLIKKQKVKHMRAVVDKLKPRYRNLVELRYYKELSYEEIAQQLDLPLGTVKAQLFRAREFLYNMMKNTEGKI